MRILKWLFVFLFLIIFLALIFLGPFKVENDRTKISSVKANIHNVQNALETFAVEHSGIYPENLEKLYNEAKTKGYWREFKNPFSEETGKNNAWMAVPPSGKIDVKTGKGSAVKAGAVLYETVRTKEGLTKYFLYGGEKADNTVIMDIDKVYYQTNE